MDGRWGQQKTKCTLDVIYQKVRNFFIVKWPFYFPWKVKWPFYFSWNVIQAPPLPPSSVDNPGFSLTPNEKNFTANSAIRLLVHIDENETHFPLQFIDLKIIWLAQRYTIISSLRRDLGITCRKPLKAWVYTKKKLKS